MAEPEARGETVPATTEPVQPDVSARATTAAPAVKRSRQARVGLRRNRLVEAVVRAVR